MRTPYELRLEESLGFLRSWAKGDFVPKVAVVLGSGLSGVFPKDSFLQSISYNDLPGFKTAAVISFGPGGLSLLLDTLPGESQTLDLLRRHSSFLRLLKLRNRVALVLF